MSKRNHETEATAEAPAEQTLVIQEILFTAPAPYSEGHVLTANEAKVLNQTYGENLRNNFSNVVKKAKEAAGENPLDEEALRTKFAEYVSTYQFHAKRQSAAQPVDPVEREALKMARETVKGQLRAKNYDLKSLAEGQLDELAGALLEKIPAIREEAARRIAVLKAVAAEAIVEVPQSAAAE